MTMQTPDIGALANDVDDLKRRVAQLEKEKGGDKRKLEDEEEARFTVKEGGHRLIEKADAPA